MTTRFLSYRQFRLSGLMAMTTAVCFAGALWQLPSARTFVYTGAVFVVLSSLHLAAMTALFYLLERYLVPLQVRPDASKSAE